jgi:hypothetical protein
MTDKLEEVIEEKKEKNKRPCMEVGCTCVNAGQKNLRRTPRRREWDEAHHLQSNEGQKSL